MVTDDNVEYPRVGAILVGCWVLTTTWNTHVLGRFRLGVGINVRDIPILFILGDSETMPYDDCGNHHGHMVTDDNGEYIPMCGVIPKNEVECRQKQPN